MVKSVFNIFIIMSMMPSAYAELTAAKFPGTIDDISFASRVENLTEGYKPFLDAKAYRELNIEPGEEIFTDHMIATAEEEARQQDQDAQTLNQDDYCKKYPYDETKCPQTTTTLDYPNIVSPTYTSNYYGYTIGGGPVIENNIVVGGSCYPVDKEYHYTNKILTTGKYENIYPALEKGLITVFRKEGGCGKIKNDPCGYTCYGIGSNCNGVIVNSRAEAEQIYHDRYWKKYKIDTLPDVISTDIFLAGMASGPGTALSQFRRFLGLPDKSSAVDDAMINAVKNYNGDIHNNWLDLREKFLQAVANKRYKDTPSVGKSYKYAIETKRKNGCHVRPKEPQMRQ